MGSKFHSTLSQAFDSNQAGGKAANLARSIASGFQVPQGFVLLRAAQRFFLESSGLIKIAQSVLEAYPGMEWQARMDRFETLQAAALKLFIPADVQEEVEPLFLQMLDYSAMGVAVRSSGVCEDLEKASFAGIYESFLGVKDVASFWQSVVLCWCSTWSPQAAAYAKKMGISIPIDGMAVLVQPMLPAESAGVAFTADPLTGNPWRFVLNSSFGLASRLVDGLAPADRFVLAWDTAEILEKSILTKPDMLVFQGEHICQVALSEAKQRAASLTDQQARSIAELALCVDRAFDRRMDLEWAVLGEQIFLLQARPLTALPPFFPYEMSAEEAEETWYLSLDSFGKINQNERLVAPFYSDYSWLEMWNLFRTTDDIFPHPFAQERDFNGYRYSTEWRWAKTERDWPRIENWLDEHEPRLHQGWLAQLEHARQANAWLDEKMAAAVASPTTRAADWLRLDLAFHPIEKENHAAGWYASQWLHAFCEGLLARFTAEVIPTAVIPDLPAALLLGLSCRSVERAIDAQTLGRGLREPFVREAFIAQPLSQVVPFLSRHHPDCAFLQDFADFCYRYGHDMPSVEGKQNVHDPDLGGALLLIKNSILGLGVDARIVLKDGVQRRQAVETCVRNWLQINRPDRLSRFNKLLGWAQFWTPALDNRLWHAASVVRLRKVNRITRLALQSEGLIDQPDHFALFTPQDWAAYAAHPDAEALHHLYQQRKLEYERHRRLQPWPYLGKQPDQKASPSLLTPNTQKESRQDSPVAKRIYQGQGIAPGKVRGITYKVKDLSNPSYLDQLSGEHILVCGRDQDNAQWKRDWCSLFMLVRGLVTVSGAQLHHATQIARECGVAFINLPEEELDHLPGGAQIEIDGQAGTLTIL